MNGDRSPEAVIAFLKICGEGRQVTACDMRRNILKILVSFFFSPVHLANDHGFVFVKDAVEDTVISCPYHVNAAGKF